MILFYRSKYDQGRKEKLQNKKSDEKSYFCEGAS